MAGPGENTASIGAFLLLVQLTTLLVELVCLKLYEHPGAKLSSFSNM